jgi:hypothetical protein
MRFTIATASTEPFSAGPNGRNLTISPDGRLLVYHVLSGATVVLYVRSIDQLDARRLDGTEAATVPFFSPDNAWLGFYDARERALRKIPIGGGPPTTIAPVASMNGASWGDDGTIVFAEATMPAGLLRVPAAGGTPEPLIAPETGMGETELRGPEVLPANRGVLFNAFRGSDLRQADVAVLDLRTGERKTLLQGGVARATPPAGTCCSPDRTR